MSRGFLRMQTSDKICQYKKSRSSLFILVNEHVNGKLLVKVFIVTFFGSIVPSPGNSGALAREARQRSTMGKKIW